MNIFGWALIVERHRRRSCRPGRICTMVPAKGSGADAKIAAARRPKRFP
jgi:hypothetical protein